MKKILFLLAIVCFAHVSFAQVLIDSVEFNRGEATYVMRILETDFSEYEVQISGRKILKSFDLRKLEGREFAEKFNSTLKEIENADKEGSKDAESDSSGTGIEETKDELAAANETSIWQTTDLFAQLIEAVAKQNDAPTAGTLTIRPRVMASLSGKNHEDSLIKKSNFRRFRINQSERDNYDLLQARRNRELKTVNEELELANNSLSQLDSTLLAMKATRDLTIDSISDQRKLIDELDKSFKAASLEMSEGSYERTRLINDSISTYLKISNPSVAQIDTINRLKTRLDHVIEVMAGVYQSKVLPISEELGEAKHLVELQRESVSKLDSAMLAKNRAFKKSRGDRDSLKTLSDNFRFLKLESLQIEFNEGMIERILAVMKLENSAGVVNTDADQLHFSNCYPIGFSTFRNFQIGIRKQLLVNYDSSFAFPLSSLISYQPNLRLNTRDFSPHDTIITFTSGAFEHKLFKDRLSEVVKGGVFMDVLGIKETEPNGLVQFEVDKRINLYTSRMGIDGRGYTNGGLFQFIKPVGTLSKVDGKLRQMPSTYIPRIVNNEVKTTLVAVNTDLLRYENFSAGMDQNVFLFDVQPWKLTVFVNYGARFGHVLVADTLRRIENDSIVNTLIPSPLSVGTFRHFPEVIVDFFPDELLKFSVQYRFQNVVSLNETLSQIPREGQGATAKSYLERSIHSIQLSATLKANPRLEFYMRYRIHMQHDFYKTNFQQMQIGTSFYLTKKIMEK